MTTDVSDAMVAALATMAGFEIAPAWRPGVAANLTLLIERAALIATPPLDATIEPAPVFRA